MITHLFQQLNAHAETRGDQPACVQVTPLCAGAVTVTYAELRASALAMSRHLRTLLPSGETVIVQMHNRPEFITSYLGALAADLRVFPLYPEISARDFDEAVRRSGARLLITLQEESRSAAHPGLLHVNPLDSAAQSCAKADGEANTPLPTTGLDRACMLLQSSGTTASPKIVRRSGASLGAVAANVAASIGLSPRDQILAVPPLCHSYGVEHGLLGPIHAGSTVHLCDTFDTRTVVPQLRARGITVLPGTPFMFEMLAESMDEASAPDLRLAYSAGAPLPASVSDAFHRRTGIRIGHLYGSTEVGSVTFCAPADVERGIPGVGYPMPGVRIVILDDTARDVHAPLPPGTEGHVAISAPSMLQEYVDEPGHESPLHEGFFLTGDLGMIDDSGSLVITGRIKLQIDIGGLKVNPLEVERVLMSHPGVRECVVVPAPVTHTLVRLRAVCTPRDPAHPPVPEELRTFAREHLSRHKVPRIFEVRDALQRTESGKLLRGIEQ